MSIASLVLPRCAVNLTGLPPFRTLYMATDHIVSGRNVRWESAPFFNPAPGDWPITELQFQESALIPGLHGDRRMQPADGRGIKIGYPLGIVVRDYAEEY